MVNLQFLGKGLIDTAKEAATKQITENAQIKQAIKSQIISKLPAGLMKNKDVQSIVNAAMDNNQFTQFISKTIQDKLPAGLAKNAFVKKMLSSGILKDSGIQQFVTTTLKEGIAEHISAQPAPQPEPTETAPAVVEETYVEAEVVEVGNANFGKAGKTVDAISQTANTVTGAVDHAANTASGLISGTANTVTGAVDHVANTASSLVSGTASTVTGAVDHVANTGKELIGEANAFVGTTASTVTGVVDHVGNTGKELIGEASSFVSESTNALLGVLDKGKGLVGDASALVSNVAAIANNPQGVPVMALTAVTELAHAAQGLGEYGIVKQQEETKREKIRAEKEMVIARINSCKELFMAYMEKSFDERKDNFAEYFKVVDYALENNNMQALQMGLQSINQLAAQSPFKGLADMNLLTQTMSSDDDVLDI